MKTRIKSLLCILSVSMLTAAAGPSAPAAPVLLEPNPCPTKPTTHELPPRYSAPAGGQCDGAAGLLERAGLARVRLRRHAAP
ncbi:MAG: hypothetical protein EOO80_07200 [Oxalobacteraceae bacterium]|nr:MAG: hypothetical protein EOO80_07200 [Oxalobacteraceae bacterium]